MQECEHKSIRPWVSDDKYSNSECTDEFVVCIVVTIMLWESVPPGVERFNRRGKRR